MDAGGSSRVGGAAVLLAAVMTFGCGHGSPGPGGSTITGNISSADTAQLVREQSSWLAWLSDTLLGFARSAYAQTRDSSLGGITVIARGGGREVSDLTDSAGGFVVSNAPTGDIQLVLRRGSCEGSIPFGGLVSNSTLTLSDMHFGCPAGSDAGSLSVTGVSETFVGVVRDANHANDVELCVREGDNDVTRHTDMSGAAFEDPSGAQTSFDDVHQHDQVVVSGDRSGAGNSFTFAASNVQVQRHDVRDDCANPF
jgi:hypothetical protein